MQMKRLVMMAVAAGVAVVAEAMPTKANLQKAKELIDDVTAADVKALKAGTKKPAEVAATHMDLAAKAGTEAEKYLLLQGAFKLYAKAGDYDAAANVIEKLQAEISDYDPEVTVELCGAEFIRKMRENAPRLYALKENARRIVFYRRQLPIRAAAVRKNPKDVHAQRKLAECHAELGDWPKALDVFVEAGGEFKKIAEGEKNGKIAAQELGDYWWDYETKSETPIYKLHAAELYRKALADNSFKGLARTRAEQRIKEAGAVAPMQPTAQSTAPQSSAGKVLVLGEKDKLNLEPCPAGKFTMDWSRTGEDLCEVTISKPFWMAETSVTERFWASVMGGSGEKSEPQSAALAEAKQFLENCNQKFADKIPEGYEFRFPTYAEYDYVLKMGGTADPNKWNLRGMRMKNGRIWLADRLTSNRSETSPTGFYFNRSGANITRIKWPKTATDPLIPTYQGKSWQVFLYDDIANSAFARPIGAVYPDVASSVRLVLAPKLGTGQAQ